MRLRSALLVALAAGAACAVLLGLDLHRALNETGGDARVLTLSATVGGSYMLALGAVAMANLTAVLLLVAAFREERAAALLGARAAFPRGTVSVPGAGKDVAAPIPAGVPATPGGPAQDASRSGTWGALAPWSVEHEGKLAELWNRSCAELYRACPKELAVFSKFLSSPEFDPETSAAALAPDGALAGVLLALRQVRFEDDGYWWLESPAVVSVLLVDPVRRRQGIGRTLLAHAETVAVRHKRPRLFVGGLENFPHLVPGVPEQDYACRLFFTALGFQEVRKTCHMEAAVGSFQTPAELVEREAKLKERGYAVRAGRAEDAPAYEAFLDHSHLDRAARRQEKFVANPEHFFLAWKDDHVAGFLQITPKDERGQAGIHLIYFQRDHRGVGLGSLLLVKAHELWKAQGANGASIWTYPEAAARFYPRAGFKIVQEWVCYQKELPHSWHDGQFASRWR